ncbi:hypothetical protein KDA_75390 [Dictyobacter alpinus]|uniref:DUF2690 domain-containing protein n=1 Tax=Dictyobacter alpinus TaxID=2014873 RepID=A0A402BL15_9CHLR|nr:DUF2690 domain-containing protein [Dictyobacter alpinus]GCE32055.1 hypothetical protein KDA_75390 [Dictyobacter alpinus]
MAQKTIGTRRPLLLSAGSILLILLLAGGLSLVFALHGSPHAFAASLQQATGATCAQAPSTEHCNTQDPELQGCAADAQTLDQMNIVENGITIGSVERRWSARCQSWWGRVFDMRPYSQANMYIGVAGATLSASPTFVSNNYRILYSFMVFDATPNQPVPAITGTLEIDGITTPPSATLPTITIPGTAQ